MCNFVSGIIMKKAYDSYQKNQILVYNGMSHSDTCQYYGIPYDSSDLVREWEWTHEDGLTVRGDDIGRLKKLIEKKFGSFDQLIRSVDNQEFKNKALVVAAWRGYLDDVKYLVEHGADVHANYDYALRVAAREGYLDVVIYLVEHGANIHADGEWALQIAVEHGHLDVVIYLVEHGANIHANYDYAFQSAAREGHLDIVKFLVECGANIHADDDCAFQLAMANGHTDVVEYLEECRKKEGLINERN